MARQAKRPELCVHRAFTNERDMLDLFADAYRLFFEEKKRVNSSERTFDTDEPTDYNGPTEDNKENEGNGPAA